MKILFSIAAYSLMLAAGVIAAAQTDTRHGMSNIVQDSWEQMISLEPCMNGAVSASGLYPSQIAENMSFSTRGVMASLPAE